MPVVVWLVLVLGGWLGDRATDRRLLLS